MGFTRFIGLILCFVTLAAEAGRPVTKEWTFFFYVAGDESDIDPWERVSLRRLEQFGSDATRWLVAHADFHRGADGKAMVSEPARRFELGRFPGPIDPKQYETLKIASPVVWTSAAETNSGDAEALRDFLAWGVKAYPAKHYALFILTHGWGWRGLGQDFNPGMAIPPSPPGVEIKYLMMSVPELSGAIRSALPAGQKLAIVGMDSCNMGTLEVAYELRDLAKIYVAAVTEMPFMGFRYEGLFTRPWRGPETFARELVQDTLASFARGGNAVALEGNYPALSLFALDLEKAGPFWSAWAGLASSLKGSNFADLFLRGREALWQDPGANADLVEMTEELTARSSHAEVRDRATALRALLGDETAPDEKPVEIPAAGAESIRVVFQGDENGEEKERLDEAKATFDALNPHLKALAKTWTAKTDSQRVRQVTLEFPATKDPILSLRPYLGGVSWARVEPLRAGQPIAVHGLGASQTYFVRSRFSAASPYLIAGHTFGAGRNHGIGVNLDPVIDPTHAANHHFAGGAWTGGRDYYRSLPFARALGWADLLFAR